MTRKIKVVLAEDHALMRDGVRLVLDEADGVEVVGEARTGPDVLPVVTRTNPDVVLLDLRMPGMDGLAVLDQLRERLPDINVVIFSALDSREQIEAALKRGADGYIVKTINPADLPSAIRQAVERSVYHPFTILANGDSAAKQAGLSEKEVAVLRELAHGRSNKEIARALYVSEQTVKFHLRNVYRKLGIATRTEALRYAYENGLIEAPV
ncbi:MAG: response regulator transcription factor [Thermoleophilia bacterium]|nr:response regulator transcription factor [Thermoleophilia bacterium]